MSLNSDEAVFSGGCSYFLLLDGKESVIQSMWNQLESIEVTVAQVPGLPSNTLETLATALLLW